MSQFVTVTPNPAIDKTYRVPSLEIGQVTRAEEIITTPGGKGVNAARMLRTLGADVVAIGFAGGANGELLRLGLQTEGLASEFVDISPEETRFAILLVDPLSARQTVVNEQGPTLGETHLHALKNVLRKHVQPGGFVLFCGSLPPGLPVSSYRDMIALVRDAGGRSLIDCTGETLRVALSARPDVVKINRKELADFGIAISDWKEDGPGAARRFREVSGARVAVVTDGANGAIGSADGAGFVMASVPRLEIVSAVGSGDSFAAGLAFALSESPDDIARAIKLASACGGANALSDGAGYATRQQIEAVSGRIMITIVA
jgi:tagatose 6-phosphate kinase